MHRKVCKVLVLDLDGTLLASDKSISQATCDSLNACKAIGIFIIVATARSEKAAEKYLARIKPDAVIVNGGALAKLRGRILYEMPLSAQTTNGIILQCLQNPTGLITAETTDGYYWNTSDKPYSSDYAHAVYNDFSKEIKPAYKLTVDIADITLARSIADAFDDWEMTCFSEDSFRRFAHKDATKGKALAAVLQAMDLAFADAIGFGDDYNDMDMIRCCGTGIAMGNAPDEVKAVADDIADTNEQEGVARYIAHYVL